MLRILKLTAVFLKGILEVELSFGVVLTTSLFLRLYQGAPDVLVGWDAAVVREVRYSDVVLLEYLLYRLGRVKPNKNSNISKTVSK